MTERQIEQVISQIPQGETFAWMYTAFEGDIRIITMDSEGNEIRYKTHFDKDDNVTIERW